MEKRTTTDEQLLTAIRMKMYRHMRKKEKQKDILVWIAVGVVFTASVTLGVTIGLTLAAYL